MFVCSMAGTSEAFSHAFIDSKVGVSVSEPSSFLLSAAAILSLSGRLSVCLAVCLSV